jgi:hypothetical protein
MKGTCKLFLTPDADLRDSHSTPKSPLRFFHKRASHQLSDVGPEKYLERRRPPLHSARWSARAISNLRATAPKAVQRVSFGLPPLTALPIK